MEGRNDLLSGINGIYEITPFEFNKKKIQKSIPYRKQVNFPSEGKICDFCAVLDFGAPFSLGSLSFKNS